MLNAADSHVVPCGKGRNYALVRAARSAVFPFHYGMHRLDRMPCIYAARALLPTARVHVRLQGRQQAVGVQRRAMQPAEGPMAGGAAATAATGAAGVFQTRQIWVAMNGKNQRRRAAVACWGTWPALSAGGATTSNQCAWQADRVTDHCLSHYDSCTWIRPIPYM